ncbi:MAG: F0F1 ATP synthase subunit epsilon [Pseudomonadota bacterium]
MQFDLVSPERRLASMEATSVLIPGTEGDLTVMADHAPTISTLRPGILKVEGAEAADYVVTGGFAEINATGVTVLAEMAVPVAEAGGDMLDGILDGARAAVGKAEGAAKDIADKQLADLEALKAAIA